MLALALSSSSGTDNVAYYHASDTEDEEDTTNDSPYDVVIVTQPSYSVPESPSGVGDIVD